MSDTDLHAKVDRLLAGMATQAAATAETETALGAVVQAVRGLVPLLATQTEMLSQVLEAATREPPGDADLGKIMANLLATMERVEAMVGALAGQAPEAIAEAQGRPG